MTAARRLAAILAADVVGYSRMMGEDEAGTATLVCERREAAKPIVAAHGGRVFKTMGDGMLIEFPSVVAAVECALAIQNMMAACNVDAPPAKRLIYRIGVHLGDILVEGEDLLGDGVNIAARLEGVADPGGVAITASAYDHVRGRIEADFVDLGERSLKNIARPVRVYALNRRPAASAGRADAVHAAGLPRLSIVVLPFANVGGWPEQDYFVDGVTECLTTDLSRISGSFVIGRSTAFAYRGRSLDLKHIGRELNVRYVLEGSLQRSRDRLRVNVQLIEAATGAHLWAERFDRPVGDLFELQDEIVARLAGALDAQLIAAEARRAERNPAPDSMDLYFQGRAWTMKGPSPANERMARSFFERALALDPTNLFARVGVAAVDLTLAAALMTDDRAERFAAAEATLNQVLSLVPDLAFAHQQLGVVKIHTHRVAHGIAECERALELDRNLASAHAFIGLAKIFAGRGEETEGHVEQALRLSPRDVYVPVWMAFVGIAKFYLGDDEDAVTRLRRAIERTGTSPSPTSVSPERSPVSVTLRRRGLPPRPGFRSMRALRSQGSGLPRRVTILSFSISTNALAKPWSLPASARDRTAGA